MGTINTAYLNAPLPPDSDWIIKTLEPHIAQACNLDPAQEYRIANALFGFPDLDRLFYQHYRSALRTEGYTILSAFDNCLLYRNDPSETKYVLVYVDDTFVFTNHPDHLQTLITSIDKHYEVTLDMDATSFRGLQLTHNPDKTVTLTQPKLLQKLFTLYPPEPPAQTLAPYAPTEFGIRDIFFCGIRDIMLDIEKYEFLVLGIKYLIILEIISLIP